MQLEAVYLKALLYTTYLFWKRFYQISVQLWYGFARPSIGAIKILMGEPKLYFPSTLNTDLNFWLQRNIKSLFTVPNISYHFWAD